MAESTEISQLFDFDGEFDVLGKDFDLSGEPNFDFSGGDIDLFGEPFGLQPREQQPSNPLSEISASPASAISMGGQSSVESSTVSPRALESFQAIDPPKSAPMSPSKQSPSPRPPQSRLPPGRDFAPVPQHLLVRRCSPPSNITPTPSNMRLPARAHPSVSSFPQQTQIVSPNTPRVGYTNMGPPPPGPLNVQRCAPIALMTAPPSGGMAPNPSKKRKADENEELLANSCSSMDGSQSSAASDAAGQESLAKRPRLEQRKQEVGHPMDDHPRLTAGCTEGQALELDLKGKENEALMQAEEYRRLRNDALGQATGYKRLGTNAIQRYNYYREKRRQLRG